jgi:hypothetical protein
MGEGLDRAVFVKRLPALATLLDRLADRRAKNLAFARTNPISMGLCLGEWGREHNRAVLVKRLFAEAKGDLLGWHATPFDRDRRVGRA